MGAEFNDYLPVVLTVLLAGGLAVLLLGLSAVVGKKARGAPVRDTPYECGMPILSEAHTRFSVKFYLVAMLFILFDIEVVFLYPFAVVFDDLPASLIFVEMLVFLAILFAGWIFIVKKGVLRWQKEE
ncbi:MAG: NADH-quinone oxidoreductase subunit A [Planctomycetes bacterium]|jgi:NADH-quinone oxidoreductase subunit A|nr:NADH-quinone oxidoreductase subunit A [Planctomycetota bacterium]